MLALDKYLGEFDKPQIVFVARQKQPKCSDEAVTATLELESYIVQGKKELTSTRVAIVDEEPEDEAEAGEAGAKLDVMISMLQSITTRLDKLEAAGHRLAC